MYTYGTLSPTYGLLPESLEAILSASAACTIYFLFAYV